MGGALLHLSLGTAWQINVMILSDLEEKAKKHNNKSKHLYQNVGTPDMA